MNPRIPTIVRLPIYLFIIAFMANVNALADLLIHPDIPYFNIEHILVGGIMAFMSTILCAVMEVNLSHEQENLSNQLRLTPFTWFMALTWMIIIFSSLTGDVIGENKITHEIALQEARTIYEKDLNYYRWATRHNGVFVPITDKTQPNPYLSHLPEQRIETSNGMKLTLVNPEYMIRQVYEMRTARHGALGHITSLDPIRAENAADAWEAKALRAFEEGKTEISSLEEIDGEPYLRMMRPMITEEECLKCHALQGYEPGDIRGGISVSIPMSHLNEIASTEIWTFTLGHIGIWLLGLLGIFFGSARLQQSINKREEAEARVRSIIDNMFDGLIILEEDASIESLNTAATKMFGYKSKELAGRSLAVLAPESEIELAGKNESPTPFADDMLNRHYEMKGCRKDGSTFSLEVSVSKMIFGPRLFYILMARDITEEKIRKTEALQAGKLAAIGELAAGVAHEINNPINGIINYAQIIHDDQQIIDNPEHEDLLKRIIKEGERVAVIVRNLLAFARQRDEHIDEINIQEIINDSISLMSHQFSKEGISSTMNIPHNMPHLRGNPQQLQQVFLNLLSNSRYALNERFPHSNPDKKIEITSQLVDLGGKKYIRTTLKDYGCGIDHKEISRIFDSMFSTKPAGKGTGLGLSISRDLVREHNGYLHVESKIDDHTTVTLDLPLPA